MSPLILSLVLVAAVVHAAWNLLAKPAGGGVAFVWLCAAVSALLWLPVAAVAQAVDPGRIDLTAAGLMAGAGVMHALYFVALQRGYAEGDLSLVYPLARGVGPLLSTAAAIAVLGERPSLLALAGAVAILGSVLLLVGSPRGGAGAGWAVLTGVAIASYTLWDKHAVDGAGVEPIAYFCGTSLANAAVLTPWALARREAVATAWRDTRRQVLGVGALSPLAYVLVLYALVHAPVSAVAPAREVSIVIGATLGTTLLAEGDRRRRLLAAAGTLAGITLLALG